MYYPLWPESSKVSGENFELHLVSMLYFEKIQYVFYMVIYFKILQY